MPKSHAREASLRAIYSASFELKAIDVGLFLLFGKGYLS